LAGLTPTITNVSTVLRPVGPHQPGVYWVRRLAVLGVIAVIIAVLVIVFSGGSSGSGHAKPPPTSPSPTTTPTTQVTACDPSVVTLVMSTDSDTYTSGQTPKLIGEFSNPGTTACTLEEDPANQVWTVKSGPDLVWTTKGCTQSGTAKQVTIKAGGTKMVSTFWNGHRLAPNCAIGAVATAGEYTLHGTLDGVKGKIAVFHITS
jgi:hypothetical protein